MMLQVHLICLDFVLWITVSFISCLCRLCLILTLLFDSSLFPVCLILGFLVICWLFYSGLVCGWFYSFCFNLLGFGGCSLFLYV